MPTPNELILDLSTDHAISIERLKDGEVKRILQLLNKTEKDLIEKVAARLGLLDERGHDLSPDTTKRLKELLAVVRADREALYKEFNERMQGSLFEFAKVEAAHQISLLSEAAGVTLDLLSPGLARLKAIATAQPFQGRLLKEWAAAMGQAETARISDAIKIGMVEGQTTDQIIQRIRGTRAAQYRDGLLEISRRDAVGVTRTAIAHVSNRAREEVWAANADIIDKVQWVATLDGRTSPVCRARDGQLFDVDKGPRPPAHFNCRSAVVAYFGEPDDDATRASAGGPVPQKTTYGDWLRKQPNAVQDDILGEAKAKLFRDGGLTVDRFVNVSGKEYSLEQLRQRDSAAFERTFGRQPDRTRGQRTREEKEFREWVGEKRFEKLELEAEIVIDANSATRRNLSRTEVAAVHAYTRVGEYHHRLNSALREDTAESVARVAPMARIMDTAIGKLPIHTGLVTRITDLPPDVVRSLKVGGTYTEKGFLSTSDGPPDSTFEGAFEMRIMARSGRKITGYSAFESEKEVLFPRGSRFAIVETFENTETGRTVLVMKEK